MRSLQMQMIHHLSVINIGLRFWFCAVFTLDEQREMLRKAENFFYGTMQTCDQVYRAKPESYFEEIASNDHNIMKVRRKGTNGDSATIINGVALDGLFFSASVPPKLMSHFGERRVLIPASEMIKHDSRLYFADFYCMYRAHYVTVVLTRPGTPADEFCRDRLLPLDLADNTFITRDPQSGSVRVCNSVGALGLKGGVWIELFCTHDIDLSASYCEFKTVPCNGISSPNRLHKTLGCCHCNLDSVLAVTVPTVTWNQFVSVPTVTWSQFVSVPTVTWSQFVSVPTVTWSRFVSVPTVTWIQFVSVPTVTWSRSVSVPTVTWRQMVSVPTVTWNQSVAVPTVTWNQSVAVPTVTWSRFVSVPIVTWNQSVSVPTVTWSCSYCNLKTVCVCSYWGHVLC